MKRNTLFALWQGTAALLLGQTAADINFGLRLDYSDTQAFAGESHRLSWWGKYGHFYHVEFRTDLAEGPWQPFVPEPLFNEQPAEQPFHLNFSLENADRIFFRIHASGGPGMAMNWPNIADSDHDGVPDKFELAATPPTHPLSWSDTDSDGLPDDWERWRSGNGSLDLENTPANYIEFKRDWATGVTVRYGNQHFVNAYLPNIQNQSRPHREHILRGDQGGSILLTYADDTLSTLSRIYVLPRHGRYAFESGGSHEDKPAAIYEANPDPQVGGFLFRAREGSDIVGYNPDPWEPIYEPNGQVVRDLLRGLDVMIGEVTTAPSTPETAPSYMAGKTRPVAFRRSEINLDGQTRVLLTPAPLAITSQPLTQISPRKFPVVLRDKVYAHYARDGVRPLTDVDFAGMGGSLPHSVELLPGWLENTLDADGLPQASFTRVKQANETVPFYSRGSFSTWFRGDNAQTYLINGVPAPTETEPGILAPGSLLRYPYGIFNDDFYPHAEDVTEVTTGSEDRDFFTTEIRMKMNYTPDTALYLAADDDCWVFINGQLVKTLDRGGLNWSINQPILIQSGHHSHPPGSSCETPPANSNDSDTCVEYFQGIRQRVGLPSSSGTCDITIFHAARSRIVDNYSTQASAIRFLSTSALRPIYHYQVVAENDGYSSIKYTLVQGPPGMILHPTNGRLEWDVFGTVDTSGSPTYLNTTHTITILAEDYLGNSDEQTFTLNVTND